MVKISVDSKCSTVFKLLVEMIWQRQGASGDFIFFAINCKHTDANKKLTNAQILKDDKKRFGIDINLANGKVYVHLL